MQQIFAEPKYQRNIWSMSFALLLFFGASLLWLGAIEPASAQRSRVVQDKILDRQYDWIIYVDVKKLDRFLSYDHSSLRPVSKIELTYRWTGRDKRKDFPQGIFQYEDLYYHEGQILGAHRYAKLPFQMNQMGCVWIRPQNAFPEEVPNMTNTIVRTVLDVYATQAILAEIIVPLQLFENFGSSLGQYNFFQFSVATAGGPGENMSLQLSSDPRQLRRYFYYDDAGRR